MSSGSAVRRVALSHSRKNVYASANKNKTVFVAGEDDNGRDGRRHGHEDHADRPLNDRFGQCRAFCPPTSGIAVKNQRQKRNPPLVQQGGLDEGSTRDGDPKTSFGVGSASCRRENDDRRNAEVTPCISNSPRSTDVACPGDSVSRQRILLPRLACPKGGNGMALTTDIYSLLLLPSTLAHLPITSSSTREGMT